MKTLRQMLAIPVGFLAFCFAFMFLDNLGRPVFPHPSRVWFPVCVVLWFAIPAALGFFVTRRVAGWRLSAWEIFSRVPKWLRVAICAGYLLTWTFGVPAILTSEHASVVESYKRIGGKSNSRVWDVHPIFRTAA